MRKKVQVGIMEEKINIKRFLKKGKDLVVDLDGVEYLMRHEAVIAIKKGDKEIPLLQLFDRLTYMIPVGEIKSSLREKGVIDYLDKRKR